MVARPATLSRYKTYALLLAILVLAFALRVHLLGGQSLWNDEGISVALAPLDLGAIVDAAAKDIHPPLYYFLLHFWTPWVGETEFALRFLSVIAGVLAVLLTFKIALVFFPRKIALLAAALAAVSPFLIYYSQETRMYVWVTLFAALSWYAMGQALPSPGKSELKSTVWLLYAAATIAMLYTQYVGAFVVLAQNAAVLIWLLIARISQAKQPAGSAWRHALVIWLIVQLVVGAAFAPWYLLAGRQLANWPSISDPLDLPSLLWSVLNIFGVGRTLEPSGAAPAAAAFAGLVLLGLMSPDRKKGWGVLTLACALLVPVLAMYIISLSRPAYNPKFLLIAVPPFCILVAAGIGTLLPSAGSLRNGRALSILPAGVLLFLAVISGFGVITSLRNYYYDPRYARDDYRAILQAIDASTRPGDGILVDDTGQIGVVRYYRRGNQPLYLLPRMRPADPNATRTDIDAMLAGTRRLFAIYYAAEQGDPQEIVQAQLAEQAFKARDEWHGDVRLAVYGVTQDQCRTPSPVAARFGEDITLQSYCLDSRELSPGAVLTITLNWRVERSPAGRYKVFVHLLDTNGRVVAQRDGEPVADRRITTTWKASESIADNYGVWIDPEIPSGDYQVEIGMYRVEDGTRLVVTGSGSRLPGDHLILDTVHISGPVAVERP